LIAIASRIGALAAHSASKIAFREQHRRSHVAAATGIEIHETRIIRLMEVLLDGGTRVHVGGWTAQGDPLGHPHHLQGQQQIRNAGLAPSRLANVERTVTICAACRDPLFIKKVSPNNHLSVEAFVRASHRVWSTAHKRRISILHS
jgi:hypothetical protein